MTGLHTDLYELTMAAGYVAAGKASELATFELFLRRLPANRNFVLAAGLEQAAEYLLALSFSPDEIDYLRALPQLAAAPPAFFELLRDFRFTGDLFAVPEGTPVFAGEPLLTVRAPIVEAQIPETWLLAMIGFQSMIASKAARVVEAASSRAVIEFGTRRAHSPEAGLLAARAAYIGGCIGTSNTAAGFRYGIPVFGTAAHSWVQSFASETEAYRRLQELLGTATVYLIDTYDTLVGARKVVELGKPLWGVRLDSGNLAEMSAKVRRVLDQGGLPDARIMVSGDLNEYRILELVAGGAPVDAFGVGTDLATSSDAPSLGSVYKLVEMEVEGIKRYTAKFSEDKQTLPGAKQIFRYPDHDVVGCSWECPSCPSGASPCEALLRPVILGGKLVEPLAGVEQARARAAASLRKLPPICRSLYDLDHPYRVEYSPELLALRTSAK
ncbi:MAG: nicotinate phosphoribosyltransferase [Acidobacteriia bacterium]|nr:nicotinate phosphoribosyltransferase [Terriglobia bacterium]